MTSPTVDGCLPLSEEDLQVVSSRARAMWYEAEDLAQKGHYKRSVQKSLSGAALYETIGDGVRKARMLGQAGVTCTRAHHFRAAAYYSWKALRSVPKENVAEKVWIWGSLARIYRNLWDFTRAEKYNRIQLKISMEQRNALQTGYAHLGLALNAYYQEDWDFSLQHALKASEIFSSSDDQRMAFAGQLSVACVYTGKGDNQAALSILQSILSPEEILADPAYICEAFEELARAYLRTGDLKKFSEARDKTAEWAAKSKSLPTVGKVFILDAEFHWVKGERRKAIQAARKAVVVFRNNGAIGPLHLAEKLLMSWLKGDAQPLEKPKKTVSRPDSGGNTYERDCVGRFSRRPDRLAAKPPTPR